MTPSGETARARRGPPAEPPAEARAESGSAPATDCAHCGLPLGRRPATATIGGVREQFCCFGCVLARQITRSSGESGAAASVLVRLGVAIFFAMNAMMVSLPTYVSAVYTADLAPIDGPLFQVLRILATAFTLPVLLLLGWPILSSAGRGWRSRTASTDALIVLGTGAAYALSLANVIAGRPEVYFDTVAMLLVLVTLGRYLEARARADAGAAVSSTLRGNAPPALRLDDPGASAGIAVALDRLEAGDFVRVAPGDPFPADGVITSGTGSVDESVLTGEHKPVLIAPGDAVPGGSSSLDGVFVVRLTARAADSTIARIEKMLAAARRELTPAQRLADRVSTVMMPIVASVALGATAFWTWHSGVQQGILAGLAVLCVACPCGLGIATPVAIWTALRLAATRGIAARNPAALERLAQAREIFFDKTGTLTERVPRLCEIRLEADCDRSPAEVLSLAADVESGLRHPVAYALERAVAEQTPVAAARTAGQATDVRLVPGRGVTAVIDGRRVSVGSLAFARAELGAEIAPLWNDGETIEVAVWTQDRLLGRFSLRESARPEAAAALAALRALGLRPLLLTGDSQAGAVVPAMLSAGQAALGLLPEDKMRRLQEARRAAAGPVVMVGDGINDGPALASADVGIAVGAATDLARTTADVALMTDDLGALPWLVTYSRRVTRIVRQNLVWVFAYNAVAVAAAAVGWLTPLIATLAMIGSSLIVVTNSRRLKSSAEPQAPHSTPDLGAHPARVPTPQFS